MSANYLLKAPRIFTGESWLEHHAIEVKNNIIQDIRPYDPAENDPRYNHCFVAPAFIDVQLYGAKGKLLSAYPSTDALEKLNSWNLEGGTAWCLPTVATNSPEVMYSCIDAVRDYRAQGGRGMLGIHLEGPWLNPEKRGAHIASYIHPPSSEEVSSLLEYGKDVIRMVTLAPEICSGEVLRQLLAANIVVSAGHSNATYTEALQGFENGITTVTHLFNAMSPLQHREPGLAGATIDHPSVMASIIPDGEHVSYPALRIAKKAMGERLFVITDAVTDTDSGPYQHYFAGNKYEAGGILSGSSLTMARSVANLVTHASIDLAEALRMCSLYPARALRLEERFGRIVPGFEAALVVLNSALEVVEVLR